MALGGITPNQRGYGRLALLLVYVENGGGLPSKLADLVF